MSDVSKSPARDRIEKLLDEHSFVEFGALVTSRSTDFNLDELKAPSDGVITGHGLIDGSLVFVYSQDASVVNGTIGEMHARKIVSVYDMAVKMGAPVIGLLDSGGVRLQESVDALESIGGIYRKAVEASGVIPQITAVFGNCGGGMSVLASLSDFTFMEEGASLFVSSPDALTGNRRDVLDTSEAQFQYTVAGNVDAVGAEDEILDSVRRLVGVLPGSNVEDGRREKCSDDLNRGCEGMEDKRYDVRLFAEEISDGGLFVETKGGYAPAMVTGFILLNGMTVGVLGNDSVGEEPVMALTAEGCEKAAAFVRFCDAFDIPLLSLTNVTGYETTVDAEKRLSRETARMVYAFASATVPKINLVTREAYGSAYIAMNAKSLGADLVYAYSDADMGTMDAQLAVKIMYPEAGAAELAEKAAEYRQLQNGVSTAAGRGYVDRIISGADTRKYLIAGFEMLFTKRVDEPYKKHGTK